MVASISSLSSSRKPNQPTFVAVLFLRISMSDQHKKLGWRPLKGQKVLAGLGGCGTGPLHGQWQLYTSKAQKQRPRYSVLVFLHRNG
jgi:hypothetical protein